MAPGTKNLADYHIELFAPGTYTMIIGPWYSHGLPDLALEVVVILTECPVL
jgi:hypothetical protein